MKVNFGEHDGMSINNVPTGYLEWAVENEVSNDHNPDFHVHAQIELDKREIQGFTITREYERVYD